MLESKLFPMERRGLNSDAAREAGDELDDEGADLEVVLGGKGSVRGSVERWRPLIGDDEWDNDAPWVTGMVVAVKLAVVGSVRDSIEGGRPLVSNEWDDVTGGGDAGVLVVLAVNGSGWMSIERWRLVGGEGLIDDGLWTTGGLARSCW